MPVARKRKSPTKRKSPVKRRTKRKSTSVKRKSPVRRYSVKRYSPVKRRTTRPSSLASALAYQRRHLRHVAKPVTRHGKLIFGMHAPQAPLRPVVKSARALAFHRMLGLPRSSKPKSLKPANAFPGFRASQYMVAPSKSIRYYPPTPKNSLRSKSKSKAKSKSLKLNSLKTMSIPSFPPTFKQSANSIVFPFPNAKANIKRKFGSFVAKRRKSNASRKSIGARPKNLKPFTIQKAKSKSLPKKKSYKSIIVESINSAPYYSPKSANAQYIERLASAPPRPNYSFAGHPTSGEFIETRANPFFGKGDGFYAPKRHNSKGKSIKWKSVQHQSEIPNFYNVPEFMIQK